MLNRTTEKTNKQKTPAKRRPILVFLKTAMYIAIVVALLLAASNAYVILAANQHIVAQQDAKPADVIIVPGALVWSDGEPSYMLKDRLDVAYELWQAGDALKILVSGDHGTKEYDEVNGMRQYLEGRGVPTEAIFMDHAGFDTYSTMYRARDVFCVKSAIVVTQKYHLYRSVYLADRMGISIQGVACDRYKTLKQPWYDLREIFARSKDVWQAEISHPRPKYLGDVIPISGSGAVTHDKQEEDGK